MTDRMNPSAIRMWHAFIHEKNEFGKMEMPPCWHFSNNQKDADELAALVVKGIKTATCSLLLEYKYSNEKIAQKGQLDIVLDWSGEAKAIIQITKLELLPFNQVSADFAFKEGEGDRSLSYWRKVHWNYFERQMTSFNELPTESMMLVCEEFEVVWI